MTLSHPSKLREKVKEEHLDPKSAGWRGAPASIFTDVLSLSLSCIGDPILYRGEDLLATFIS